MRENPIKVGSRLEAPITVSREVQAPVAGNGRNWLEMIHWINGDIGRLMCAEGQMDIMGVAKIVSASESLVVKRLVHNNIN